MKDTCRLTKRTKDLLIPYSDDANEAIAGMWGELVILKAKLDKEKAVVAALQSTTPVTTLHYGYSDGKEIRREIPLSKNGSTGFISASALKNGVPVPGIEDLAVREVLVDGQPEAYWKRLKKELDEFLTLAQGKF